jgi:hypothetical protein
MCREIKDLLSLGGHLVVTSVMKDHPTGCKNVQGDGIMIFMNVSKQKSWILDSKRDSKGE